MAVWSVDPASYSIFAEPDMSALIVYLTPAVVATGDDRAMAFHTPAVGVPDAWVVISAWLDCKWTWAV